MDLTKMNEAQRLAVTHGEGPLLLLAGPGSGKTYTITQRIFWLLEQGTAPERILVITFTKDAASSMQQRFRKLSSVNFPVNFGTFHSVFYHILKESGYVRTEHPLTQTQKKKILLPILKDCSPEAFRELLQEDTTSILNAISFYKNTMSLEKAAEKAPEEWREAFRAVLERYEAARAETGAVDFDDMVWECRNMLSKQPHRRQYWQNRFDHILMDEFQDINPVQYETVKLLAKPPCNLFAVGDDDQAIYGFRGAQPECLKRFQEEFCARQLLLNINYRSCAGIIEASGKVIGENKNRFPKRLLPASCGREAEGGGFAGNGRVVMGKGIYNKVLRGTDIREENRNSSAVILRPFSDREEQYSFLIRRLGAFPHTDSCAVLFRTNTMMQGVATRLRSAGIPYVMKEKIQSIYDHFIVRDIISYLQLAQGNWSRERFLYICNRPSRYISREALTYGDSLQQVKAYYAHSPCQLAALEQLERQLKYMGRAAPKAAVAYICRAAGYEGYLKEQAKGHPEKWMEWKEILEWVRADAARFARIQDWLTAQEEYNMSLRQQKTSGRHPTERLVEEQAGGRKAQITVNLMTVHGSKGLEFDHVLIPDCNERAFPHGKMVAEDTCEEERRIFYVAMTRAAKSLELFYLDETEDAGAAPPSRFLNPLL